MNRSLCSALVLCMAAAGCRDTATPVATPDCDIVLEPVLTLGANAGPAGPTLESQIVRSDGLYFVSATHNPGQVSVFDAQGELLHSIGRSGRGPGENEAAARIAVTGDTIYVLDGRLRRIQAFHVNGAYIGGFVRLTEQTPFASSTRGGLILLRGASRPGRVTLERLEGQSVAQSFAFSNEATEAGEAAVAYIADMGESVWLGFIRHYLFERYAYDGTLLDRIAADPPHFPGGLSRAENARLDSIALVADLAADSSGRLLALHIVRTMRRTQDMREQRDVPMPDSVRAILEIFRPTTGQLVARYIEHKSRLRAFADADHVYALVQLDDGTPVAEVFRIRIIKRNSQQICE